MSHLKGGRYDYHLSNCAATVYNLSDANRSCWGEVNRYLGKQ